GASSPAPRQVRERPAAHAISARPGGVIWSSPRARPSFPLLEKAMLQRLLPVVIIVAVLGAVGAGAYLTRQRWAPLIWPTKQPEGEAHEHAHGARIKLTPQARENLKLDVRPVMVQQVYWKTALMPGTVVDRPGQSDRGVTAPITGVVAQVFA